MLKKTYVAATAILYFLLSGCAGVQSATQHSSISINTTESSALFLEPDVNPDKSLYIQVQNTANENGDFKDILIAKLQEKGYQIVTDRSQAKQILDVNLASLTRVVHSNMDSKADEAGAGLLAGGAVAVNDGSATGSIAAGGIAALGASVINGILQDISYTIVAQIQIQDQAINGNERVMPMQVTQIHQTNIITTVDQVNLSLVKATPVLLDSVASSIAGIFN